MGVNTDRQKDDYEKKIARFGVTWRSAWQGSTRGPIPTRWGIQAFPTTFVLDADQVIRHVNVRGEELERVVAELLEQMKKDEGGSRSPR